VKLGILTFHWADNYGAVLQAWALQRYLTTQGVDCEIVDYRPHPSPRGLRAWVAKRPGAWLAKLEYQYKRRLFESFRRRHLRLSSRRFSSWPELRPSGQSYDTWITGSDQVWNPRWLEQREGMAEAYFLAFPDNMRRISYAASFGHGSVETIPSEWRGRICQWLRRFDLISVRETSGVELVRQLGGRDDVHVVADPTLLHDREMYDHLATPVPTRGDYLFGYILHHQDPMIQPLVRRIANQMAWRPILCNTRDSSWRLPYRLPSVGEWLGLIRGARLVITNSFHCVAMCLLFRVPFLAITMTGALATMNRRLLDLLELCDLHERIVQADQVVQWPSCIGRSIDWDHVHHVLQLSREHSFEFLKHAVLSRGKPCNPPSMETPSPAT